MENLVVCVDRDDDVGRKTKAVGPVIGVEANLAVARDLALADPEDTDTNAIFAAIKIAKELGTEIVTLTGDKSVGVVSDTKIGQQLDSVIEQFKPKGVILVFDGAEDAQIIPVIESRIKINSVKTVIVRQSQELEKAYFKISNFLKEIESDPNLARLVFGIPGLVLMLLAIGGAFGVILLAVDILLAMIGIYLLMKGFGYEEEFFWRVSQFFKSLSVEKVSTFIYAISIVVLAVAVGYGYVAIMLENPTDPMRIYAAFVRGSVDLLFATVVIGVIGKIIDDYSGSKYLNVRADLVFLSFAFFVKLTVEAWARFIYNPLSVTDFVLSVLAGALIFLGVIKLTEYSFMEEIQERKKVLSSFAGKKVFDEKGELIGKVSKVLLDDSRLLGIKVKGRTIPKEDIVSSEEKVTVRGGAANMTSP
jgi:putative membrane protein